MYSPYGMQMKKLGKNANDRMSKELVELAFQSYYRGTELSHFFLWERK